MTSESAATRMARLLDEAATAARRGDIARLATFGEALDLGVRELGAVPSAALADLRARAHRNATLIAAAHKGVMDAQTRLRAIGSVARGLTVYTEDGRGLTHRRAAVTLERRA